MELLILTIVVAVVCLLIDGFLTRRNQKYFTSEYRRFCTLLERLEAKVDFLNREGTEK